MAFFPIHRYQFFDDPFDRFFSDQLDFFDPWYDFDTLPSTFRWINPPQQLVQSSNTTTSDGKSLQSVGRSVNAEKFRVQLNVTDFNPESIQIRVDGLQVIVEAKKEDRQNDDDDDCNIREIRKIYDLPEYAVINQLISYVTPNNILVIEVPIRNPEAERRLAQALNDNQILAQFGEYRDPYFDHIGFLRGSDFQSRIVDKNNNEKQLELSIEMKKYRPEEIKILEKNNELIVQGEHRQNDANNRLERSFFFKSTILPPGTQVNQLKARLTDDGQLKIEAPFIENSKE